LFVEAVLFRYRAGIRRPAGGRASFFARAVRPESAVTGARPTGRSGVAGGDFGGTVWDARRDPAHTAHNLLIFLGEPGGNRAHDPKIKSDVVGELSHFPVRRLVDGVGRNCVVMADLLYCRRGHQDFWVGLRGTPMMWISLLPDNFCTVSRIGVLVALAVSGTMPSVPNDCRTVSDTYDGDRWA
jgi:hypothetical protein